MIVRKAKTKLSVDHTGVAGRTMAGRRESTPGVQQPAIAESPGAAHEAHHKLSENVWFVFEHHQMRAC